VVNYVQWRNQRSFKKMLKNPRAMVQMNDALSISKVDGSLYEVVFVESLTRRNCLSQIWVNEEKSRRDYFILNTN
jgi:hypothetical protein